MELFHIFQKLLLWQTSHSTTSKPSRRNTNDVRRAWGLQLVLKVYKSEEGGESIGQLF